MDAEVMNFEDDIEEDAPGSKTEAIAFELPPKWIDSSTAASDTALNSEKFLQSSNPSAPISYHLRHVKPASSKKSYMKKSATLLSGSLSFTRSTSLNISSYLTRKIG